MVTLVIEGGASRAAYAFGAALALQEAGFTPDAIYGTSAGGACAAWYAAGQMAQGVDTWDAASDRSLWSYRRGLQGGPIIDFRRLYGHYYPHVFGLDLDHLRAAPYPVFATVTHAKNATTRYVDLRTAPDPLAVLHATSALPLVSEAPVVLADGEPYVDGGVTAPIPLARAIEDGHRDIIVLANRPAGPRRPEPEWMVRLVSRRFPELEEHLRAHHRYHDEGMALATRPPAGVRVRLVRPSRDTGVSRFTRDGVKLRRAAKLGHDEAMRIVMAAPLP